MLSWLLDFGFRRGYQDVVQRAVLWWAGICAVAIFLFFILFIFRTLKKRSVNFFGTARLATTDELARSGMLTGNGVVLGETNDARVKIMTKKGSMYLRLRKPGRLITNCDNTSTLVIAPPRSGKGMSVGVPSQINHRGSLISIDLKGENYEYTAGYRRKDSIIIKYAPGSDDSAGFNFLLSIRSGSDAWTDANMLASTMLAPKVESKEDENTAHFRTTATTFLTGIILHVLCSGYMDKTLGGCLDFLTQAEGGSEEETGDKSVAMLQEMINAEHCDESIHKKIVSCANEQLCRPGRERGSVTSTVLKVLSIFRDDRIRKNTSRSDFTYEDFVDSKRPISLYFTLNYAKLDQTQMLVRLFISMMLRRFTDAETSADDVRMKNQLLICLDEFTALGAFNFLQSAMAVVPGYGIKFLIICQSASQLNAVYGPDHQFFALCKNIVVFAPGDYNSSKMFCDMIGKESVWKESTSTGGNRYDIALSNLNLSGSDTERNLINPDEMMKLPYNRCLILTQGQPPYIGNKVVDYDDKRFKDNMYSKKLHESAAKKTSKGKQLTDKEKRNEMLRPPMTQSEILNVVAPLRKVNDDRPWYTLPLFTCMEKQEEIVIDKRLIDPRLVNTSLASEALSVADMPLDETKFNYQLAGI